MAESPNVLLIRSPVMIDGTGAPAVDDGMVLIAGKRIVAAGRSCDVEHIAEAAGAVRVDVLGTVIPGIIDGDAHVAYGSESDPAWQAAKQDRDLVMAWAAAR